MDKMIRLLILTLAAVLSVHGHSLASGGQFRTVELEMDTLDAEVLFKKEPTDTSTFPVKMMDSGSSLPGRVEVTGSFTRNFLKKSILIKLDEGYSWKGKRKISLRSMSTDLSYMREKLAWDLIGSLGMVRPDVEYVRLNINGQFIGIFLYIEWIDTGVFDRFGLGKDGEFFHPDDQFFCGDMTMGNQERLDECWLKLSPRNKDYTPLRKLIEEINSTPVEEFDNFLFKNFDVDSVINWLVVNTITGNGDTYNKNYFIYLSKKTGKWVIIPWDFDLSFGRNADPVLTFPRNILNDNYQYFYPPELGSASPLKEKTLKNPRLFRIFKKRISHALGVKMEKEGHGGFGWFAPDQYGRLVRGLEETIGQEMSKELYPGIKGAPFREQIDALINYNRWRHPLLKKLILDPTPFNTPHWLPYANFPELESDGPKDATLRQIRPLNLSVTENLRHGDKEVVMMEELLARPVGILKIGDMKRPVRIRLEAETEQAPDVTPPGIDPKDCILRSWYLDLKTPGVQIEADLEVDYLQESSIRHDLGEGVTDEYSLSLWMMDNDKWRKLPTSVNTISNVLKTEGVHLSSGNTYRFVACTTK